MMSEKVKMRLFWVAVFLVVAVVSFCAVGWYYGGTCEELGKYLAISHMPGRCLK